MYEIENPYKIIFDELLAIRNDIASLKSPTCPPTEVIDRPELLKRLSITEPTAITWGKKGKIPEMRLGSIVRYNWPAVVAALENKGK